MLYLSDFDKKKVLGLVYLFGTDKETSEEEVAINCFNDALKIKEDKSLYYFIALALCRLRRYKEAKRLLKNIKRENLYIPERFKDFYQTLISHFDGELFNGKKPGEA